MTIRIFSPIARTGLRDRKQARIDREIAQQERAIERLDATIEAFSREKSERESIKAALSDSRVSLAIEGSVSELLDIDFQQAAE